MAARPACGRDPGVWVTHRRPIVQSIPPEPARGPVYGKKAVDRLDFAQDFANIGKYAELEGDGHAGEEFIKGPRPGTKGGTFVDLTAKAADGATVRVQTINTLADGATPTRSEAAAAARIRAAFPNDKLLLIPKRMK